MQIKRNANGQFTKGSMRTIHGCAGTGKRTKEYRTWVHMKTRCSNPNVRDYRRYGGRGIKVCQRWLESFQHFLDDMGKAPSPLHQIDRINVNNDYSPQNCRWATVKEQANNTRRSVRVHLRERSFTITEACERYELDRHVLKEYVQRRRDKGIPVTYTEAFFFARLKKEGLL